MGGRKHSVDARHPRDVSCMLVYAHLWTSSLRVEEGKRSSKTTDRDRGACREFANANKTLVPDWFPPAYSSTRLIISMHKSFSTRVLFRESCNRASSVMTDIQPVTSSWSLTTIRRCPHHRGVHRQPLGSHFKGQHFLSQTYRVVV